MLPVVLGYGMGWDSTSVLLRWLNDPSSRDFPLSDLIVLSAQTGLEFDDTQRLVEEHVLPRLRKARIRYVQVARAGSSEKDGIVVLSDTRAPAVSHTRPTGTFTLADELLAVGTVPQYASGKRLCTLKHKGTPLDRWQAREFGDRPYRHVIGFNADELKRAERDRSDSTVQRQSEYPLIDWGWGREQVEDYLIRATGVTWRKSACTVCPFAGGKKPMLLRYREFPEAGAFAIFLEHVSLALNPKMTLFSGGKSVRAVIREDGNQEALELAEQMLSSCEWGLYHVQRIYYAAGIAWRRVSSLERGSRAEMGQELIRLADRVPGVVKEMAGSVRLHIRQRGDEYPTCQEFYVAAPGVVVDKSRPGFGRRWQNLTCGLKQLEFAV